MMKGSHGPTKINSAIYRSLGKDQCLGKRLATITCIQGSHLDCSSTQTKLSVFTAEPFMHEDGVHYASLLS